MTDCAFSCPISVDQLGSKLQQEEKMERTLVVVHNVSQMVATAVMSFTDAHRVVSEVDIAVVAWGISV